VTEPGLRILVVDDEPAIRRFLRASLAAYATLFEAATGREALDGVVAHRPDLIVLDLGLPDIDGVEVTRLLREWTRIPIIILSVRGSERDKIAALDAGADDYLTKPFAVGELMARVRVAMRHAQGGPSEPIFSVGGLVVDRTRRRVTLDAHEVQLTPTEYDLLKALVNQAGRVLTHRQLLREVWGKEYELDTHTLRVNISNLRRKIEPDPARPRYLVTEPGVGYRLRSEL
jgi:two-component system KDP operon response regulator KdpE